MVVGIDHYPATRWKNLRRARLGAQAVAELLSARDFEVTLLLDEAADRRGILEALERVAHRSTENDRVLFYFAGHGATRDVGGRQWGSLVPFDGDDFTTHLAIDELRTRSEIMGRARHQLFLIDACYGGHFAERRGELPSFLERSQTLRDLWSRRSRQYITAGDATQQVSDTAGPGGHSVFTGHLLQAVRDGLADSQTDGFVTFHELSAYLEKEASNALQTPVAGTFPGHEGGGFFFAVRPGTALPRSRPPASTAPTRPRGHDAAGEQALGVETDLPRTFSAPREIQLRHAQSRWLEDLGYGLSVSFEQSGATPYAGVVVQTREGHSTRKPAFRSGAQFEVAVGARFFRVLVTTIDWESRELSLSIAEAVE